MVKWLAEDMGSVYDSVVVEADDEDSALIVAVEKMMGCPTSFVDRVTMAEILDAIVVTRLDRDHSS